jgi:hypothetical protein
MTPERMAALVARWVRFYTRELPAPIAERRVEEIDADVHDHIAHERDAGTGDRRIALGIATRMLRGVAADAAWRNEHAKPSAARRWATTTVHRTAYRLGVAVAVGASLMLLWLMGAVGVIGVEGDRADLMYFGVLAIGPVGAAVARLRPHGMARTLLTMAAATGMVGVVALLEGRHQAPISSVYEIVGLNGFFAALFLASAWLFEQAARRRAE